MSNAPSGRGRAWALRLGGPLGALLLTLVFAALQLPWNRLGDRLAFEAGHALGAEVEVAGLGPGLGLAGPWLVARDVEIRWPGSPPLSLERARLRPAWSLSWLRGQPALALDLLGPAGHVEGTLWPSELPGFSGTLAELDPAALPPHLLGNRPPPFTGKLDADVDLSPVDGGRRLAGRVRAEVRDGALLVPGAPLAIPFERLSGVAALAADGGIRVRDLALQGPMIALSGAGQVGPAPTLARAPLSLDLRIDRVDPALAPVLATAGLRVGRGGGTVEIRGTLDNPRVGRR